MDTYITNRTQRNKVRTDSHTNTRNWLKLKSNTKGWFVDPSPISGSIAANTVCATNKRIDTLGLTDPPEPIYRMLHVYSCVVVSVHYFKVKNLDFVFTWLSFLRARITHWKGVGPIYRRGHWDQTNEHWEGYIYIYICW